MKRIKLALIILLALSMTGCVKKYSATEEQTNAIAEYMAGLILDYDQGYKQALLPEEDLQEDVADGNQATEAPAADNTQTEGADSNAADSQSSATMSEVIGNRNFDITYKSYQISKTYPEDSENALFVIKHSNGYRLFIITFDIKNTADKKKTLKLTDDNISFQLQVNSDKTYSPLLTLLENDLQYIDMKIGAGMNKESLLIFEIPEKADISNAVLTVTRGDGKSAAITIK